jgi:hypothetical protein
MKMVIHVVPPAGVLALIVSWVPANGSTQAEPIATLRAAPGLALVAAQAPDSTHAPAAPPTAEKRAGQINVPSAADSGDVRLKALRTGFFESPTGTLLRSVAFPGWGQWANGKKQKAAVYFGIEGYFITKALIWRHRARQNVDFDTFNHARDRRNYFYWFTGLTIFVSMFDAYTDRYLLTLEQMRDRPDDYWGGQTSGVSKADDGWRLLLGWRF